MRDRVPIIPPPPARQPVRSTDPMSELVRILARAIVKKNQQEARDKTKAR